MKHDPEKNAAAYVSGVMSRHRRKAFERHILECEDCWSEVDMGRRGRSLAEAGRDLAPHALRERVRTSVSATRSPSRAWTWRVAALAIAVIIVIVVGGAAVVVILSPPAQPREIAVLVEDFRNDAAIDDDASSALPHTIGDLKLRDSDAGRLGGMRVTAHEYSDAAGHKVVVYQADETFPVASGATHAANGQTWTAEIDDAVMFCADRPVPSLVIGDDRKEVTLAAAELGLE